jgi:hypothetical protein
LADTATAIDTQVHPLRLSVACKHVVAAVITGQAGRADA